MQTAKQPPQQGENINYQENYAPNYQYQQQPPNNFQNQQLEQPLNYNYNQQPNFNYQQNQNYQADFNNEDYPPNYQQSNNIGYPGQNQDCTIQIKDDKQSHLGEDSINNGMELLGKNTRLGFIRKVYGILAFQLLITIGICIITMVSDSFARFQRDHYWIAIICGVFAIIIVLILICFQKYAKKIPNNYILLFTFTIFESYLVSYCCAAVSNKQTVLIAAILTGTITIFLTLYALFTRHDYTKWYQYLFVFLIVAIMCTFFCIFWREECPILNQLICGLMVIIYGFYLIADTQVIAGGKKYELSYDDYIIGALLLYVDIIGIFIYLLSMLGNNN